MCGRIKVLYIAGSGRSGSTFLGQVLGQVPGFCFVGETLYAWHTFDQHRLCGCGTPLVDCTFWHAVRQAAGGGTGPIEPRELFAFARGSGS
jgi:hypothetical protein